MGFNFGFTDQDFQSQQGAGTGTQYIKGPGAEIVAMDVRYEAKGQNQTPGFTVTFTNDSGAICEMWQGVTENSFTIAKSKVADLAKNAGLQEQLKAATAGQFTSVEQWVSALATVLKGGKVAAAFKGREYVNKEGKHGVAAEYWFSNPTSDFENLKKYVADNSAKATVKLNVEPTTPAFNAAAVVPPAFDPFAVPMANTEPTPAEPLPF